MLTPQSKQRDKSGRPAVTRTLGTGVRHPDSSAVRKKSGPDLKCIKCLNPKEFDGNRCLNTVELCFNLYIP